MTESQIRIASIAVLFAFAAYGGYYLIGLV